MTWAEIKIALKLLPEIITLVKLLVKKVQEGIEVAQIKVSIEKMDKALHKAVYAKDTSSLEDIFRGKK